MTKIGKCLAVFTLAASLAFLGLVSVAAIGGPNWDSLMNAEDLQKYALFGSEKTGEVTTWKASIRQSGETIKVPKDRVPASAIIAARERMKQDQQEEAEKLQQQIDAITPRVKEAGELIEVDVKALKKRETELVEELDALNKQIEDEGAKGIRKSQEAQAIRAEGEKRREDVARLTVELAGIRTDLFRARVQAVKLKDLLVRVNGKVLLLKRRNTQLQSAGAKLPYEEKPGGKAKPESDG